MSSQSDAMNLRRAGMVAGFYPAGVPHELRDELVQPINPHKASDNVVPTAADVATRLSESHFAAAFPGKVAVTATEEASLAVAVDEPSLAIDLASHVAGVVAPGAGTVGADAAEKVTDTADERDQLLASFTDEQRAIVAGFEQREGRQLSNDELRTAFNAR